MNMDHKAYGAESCAYPRTGQLGGCIGGGQQSRMEMGNGSVGNGVGSSACRCAPCGENSWGLNDYPLAMVYAPCQAFRNLYDADTALTQGTLFAELYLPLGGYGSTEYGNTHCKRERGMHT